ncbi:unnamed protein product, partial [Chrysoparadoxa australica]
RQGQSDSGSDSDEMPFADQFQDEEIDEDEAFNSEDERKYGSLLANTSSKASKKARKAANRREPDDEDEGEDGDGGDLLSDLLGSSSAEPAGAPPSTGVHDGPGDEEGSSSDSYGSSSDGSDSSDSEDDEEGGEKLAAFVDGLAKSKELRHQKRQLVAAGQRVTENAFGAEAPEGSTGPLTMDALMGSLGSAAGLQSMKKQLQAASAKTKAPKAPLAKALQTRAERELANEAKVKDMKKWEPVVQANRRAEVVNFKPTQRTNLSSAALVGKFQPNEGMEEEITKLLMGEEAGGEEALARAEKEELAAKEISVEELKERQDQLKKVRSLLFQRERKRRHINKIKSKLYRKLRNKQAKRRSDSEREGLREVDPELAAELDAKEARGRAEERMTLRHRNGSRWAKHALRRGVSADASTKAAMREQLKLGQDLRKKQTGRGGSDQGGDSDSDNSSGDEMDHLRLEHEAGNGTAAYDALAALGGGKGAGILKMDFMRKAEAAQAAKARQEQDDLLEELNGLAGESDQEEPAGAAFAGAAAESKGPRRSGRSTKVAVDGAISVDLAMGEASNFGSLKMADEAGDDEGEHILTATPPAVAVAGAKRGARTATAAEGANTKSKTKAKAGLAETSQTDNAARDEEGLPQAGEGNPWLMAVSERGGGRGRRQAAATSGRGKAAGGTGADEAMSAVAAAEVATQMVGTGEAVAEAEASRKLVQAAFAGTDTAAEFRESKGDQVSKEVGQGKKKLAVQESNGWGSWIGAGAPAPKPKKRLLEEKRKEVEREENAKRARRDAKLPTVVITEKRSKQSSKFKLAQVPYPFTSREQYERSLRQPMGAEWNTAPSVKDMTNGGVLTRAGTIIDPIKAVKKKR